MSDVHALVGAYAADAVDDVERAAFARHLTVCQACRLELEGLQETVALLGSSEPAVPPARLRQQVLAGIETVRPLPPLTTPAARDAEVRRRRFRPATLVAAAAALIALGAGATIWQPWDDESSQGQQLTDAERVLAAPDAEKFSQSLDDGAEVTVVRSRSLNQAVLVAEGLPPAPEGKVYELWLNHDDAGMVPAGLTNGEDDQVVFKGDAATAVGAGVTLEPEGGSEEPTLSAAVALIEFEST
jgi:anti-sigma factor RsiW